MTVSLALAVFSFTSFVTAAITPKRIGWSEKTYGFDGPWQAVTVTLGNPPQPIDLFPGGFWASNILEASICNSAIQQPVCFAQAAGVFNSSASISSASFSQTGGFIQNAPLWPIANVIPQFGSVIYKFDELFISDSSHSPFNLGIPTLDMLVLFEAYSLLPDGSMVPMEVGNLALGAPDTNQSWVQGNGLPNINGTFLPSYLHAQGLAESNSFGLHIGSASLALPGSLYIGGYDQNRVLSPVSTQKYGADNLPIDLLDIGIGVAEGLSPFSFTSKTGLLSQGNSSIVAKLGVDIDATVPYLYLPWSTCDAIAQNLPVTYQNKYGLYFWDTSSPLYHQIVSSPTYLSFTFRLNETISQNMTINVPFALLNLTMTAPLVSGSTQYFPCNPVSGLPSADNRHYALGKAFLQAAFLGVNWQSNSDGRWFLAQAPGPNTPTTPVGVAIGQTDDYITASQNAWVDSWSGVWTTIETKAVGTNSSESLNSTSISISASSSSTHESATATATAAASATATNTSASAPGLSLSPTLITVIAMGCALVAATISIGAFFLIRRRRNRSPATAAAFGVTSSISGDVRLDYIKSAGFRPREMQGFNGPVEMGTPRGELDRASRPRTLNRFQPAEMWG